MTRKYCLLGWLDHFSPSRTVSGHETLKKIKRAIKIQFETPSLQVAASTVTLNYWIDLTFWQPHKYLFQKLHSFHMLRLKDLKISVYVCNWTKMSGFVWKPQICTNFLFVKDNEGGKVGNGFPARFLICNSTFRVQMKYVKVILLNHVSNLNL